MAILKLHSEPLQDSWLDAYGHLNEAYSLVPFSNTTWKLQDHFGIGVEYFEKTGCALFTLETHLRYLAEVRSTALITVESIVIGCDAKRIWYAHLMYVGGILCATAEFMGLHYNTEDTCACAMSETVQQALKKACVEKPPPWVGCSVSLEK